MFCWYLTLKAMFLRKHQYHSPLAPSPRHVHAAAISGITKQLKIKQQKKSAFFISDFSSSALISPTQVYHQHYFFHLMRPNGAQFFPTDLQKKKRHIVDLRYIITYLNISVAKKKSIQNLWLLVISVFQNSTCHFLQGPVIFSNKETKTS